MKDIDTREHEALRRLLRERRRQADMTQEELAKKLGRSQTFVSAVESGQYVVSFVQFLKFAAALGFDPCAAVRRVARDAGAKTAAKTAR